MADILSFDGRVVIVTGAGGGLGRSHALELARRGALVVVNDLGGALDGTGSGHTAADLVVKEIEDANGTAVANFDSVTTPEGGQAIVQTALDNFGRVDVVINNAGILRDKAFHKMAPEDVQSVIDVHLIGAFNVTAAAWPHMREAGYGRVINTSSGAGLFGNFGQANYAAAKMGLVGLTRTLAVEGASKGIKVNAIAPVAQTRMTTEIFANLGLEDVDLGPEHVTSLVTFLASEACPSTGDIYGCAGDLINLVFIAETPGVVMRGMTAEDVRDSHEDICDEEGYTVPSDLNEQLSVALLRLNRPSPRPT